jgi:AcrR family transcriptional regulator
VRRGEETHQAILGQAAQVASRRGLAGLTIGALAEELHLSKSGLFAHFHSKETLQVQTLQFAARLFVERVVRPALETPRGEPRVRALFEGWMQWARADILEGGCLFVAAATEVDDQEGPVRDELVRQQRDWMDLIVNVARTGVDEGHFRPDLDTRQLAHDLYGVMLAFHHARRLLRDPEAESRARRGFEALVLAARAPNPKPPLDSAGPPSGRVPPKH